MTKREDIQGIRGLAIAAVLAFHLNDAMFPAGFVGVDMFFVLSGYLMSVILGKEEILNLKVFGDFYKRRFKRIVPLYAILIAALLILVPCFLLQRDVLKFYEDVLWAACFATNIHTVLEDNDYFAELYDSNVLTHTWSLGVEIQYYLIVPFIVLAHRKLSEKCNFFLHLLLLGSLAFQLLSSPNASFNLLPSRVWQFITGGLAHDLSSSWSADLASGSSVKYEKLRTDELADAEEGCVIDGIEQPTAFSQALESLSTDFLSFALVALVLSPWIIFPIPVLRFIAVLMTGGLLVMGAEECRQGVLLTMRPLVYLGDLSYIVYLAHWPVVVMWKSVADVVSLPMMAIACCFAITFVVSVIAHHTIEQYFIRAKAATVTIVVGILYGFFALALMFSLPLEISKRMESAPAASSVNVTAAMKWNEHESHAIYYKSRPFKECVDDSEGKAMRGGYSGKREYECVWKPKNSTGSLKVLVMGNSISHRATKIIKPVIEKSFPQVALMRLYAMSACRPIEPARGCVPFLEKMPVLAREMQPDVTFVIWDNSKRLLAPLTDAANDAATADLIAFLKPIANASGTLILDEFYPTASTSAGMANSMHKRLLREQSTKDLKGTLESFTTSHSSYFARLDNIHIPNLLRHNTSAGMCGEEKGVCWWYNRRNLHAYFTDNVHLSSDGQELMMDSYSDILKKAIDRLGA